MSYTILTPSSWKGNKSVAHGYATALLFLSPHTESGLVNLCPKARTCQEVCLKTAGRNIYGNSLRARVRRTRLLVENREFFLSLLHEEIEAFVRRSLAKGLQPCIRPNGLSDQAWLGQWVAEQFPTLQVYDYTKLPKPWLRTRSNYSLVFSFDGLNWKDAEAALAHNVNVAVVFAVSRDATLPRKWRGHPVIDGDVHDLRFLDPAGVIVGLRAKGAARRIPNKFVVNPWS